MLNLISNITITQRPTTSYPDRNNVYTLDFVNDVEIDSTWDHLTDTAKVVFPKNVYVQTPNGNVSLGTLGEPGQDIYGKTKNVPILLRGDKINVRLGYYYKPFNSSEYRSEMNEEFDGYITSIDPKTPLELKCEDAMWLLKQAQCPNKMFAETDTVESIIKYLLNNATVNPSNTYLSDTIIPELKKIVVVNGVGKNLTVQTNVGQFRTYNETIAQVLNRLRKDYKLECFFRRKDGVNYLFVSAIVYYPSDYMNPATGEFIVSAYDFQNNIIENNMIYIRKDDVRLGIKAISVTNEELNGFNSDGGKKSRKKRVEISVGDTDGEIRTQFFWPASHQANLTKENLAALALQRLPKLKYEGWRGDFTSFGLPIVRHGEAISLKDFFIPEREGTYLVRSVKTKFGTGGFRRTIGVHLRIDGNIYSQEDFQNGL